MTLGLRFRAAALLALLFVTLTAAAEPKRRAVSKPFIDFASPEGWLIANAYPLASVEPVSYSWDLEPLRAMVGDAAVVGLGDGTHGTREFYTVKLRVIDFLVRELGFDVVALEAPFPHCNRLNDYVQGGAGDPRALLRELSGRLSYLFWNTEETLALIEWMREYNAHRGTRPPIELAGADIHDQLEASKHAVAYLRGVDPAAAATAEQEYGCMGERLYTFNCTAQATRVYDALAAREAELVPVTSAREFHDALQYARVVVQSQSYFSARVRDRNMALNTLWMREHRGASGRVILWAHNAHLTRGPSELAQTDAPAGENLGQALGDRYFSIATMTASGSYTQWDSRTHVPKVTTFPPLPEGSYEGYFRLRRMPLLIPLRGTLPPWLVGPARYNEAGVDRDPAKEAVSLPEKFDAVIFVESTTPARVLP